MSIPEINGYDAATFDYFLNLNVAVKNTANIIREREIRVRAQKNFEYSSEMISRIAKKKLKRDTRRIRAFSYLGQFWISSEDLGRSFFETSEFHEKGDI